MAQFRLWDPFLAGSQPHNSKPQLTEGKARSWVSDVLGSWWHCLTTVVVQQQYAGGDPYSVTYFYDLVIMTLSFAIDKIPSIPLLFPSLPCFSPYFSCSPLFTVSFSSDEVEIHSLLLLVPLLWSPYESHSLKFSASEQAGGVKEPDYFKLQGDRKQNLWQSF